MEKARVGMNAAEMAAAIVRAKAEGSDAGPVAESVTYLPAHGIFIVTLTSGERLVLLREKLQGLQNATKAQLANVRIEMLGTALTWPDLDVDLYVPALRAGIFGTKKWMSELGRAGGRVTSLAKAASAKVNGAKGGRPKKQVFPAAAKRVQVR